jgi:hypothetical protein
MIEEYLLGPFCLGTIQWFRALKHQDGFLQVEQRHHYFYRMIHQKVAGVGELAIQ